MLSSMQCGEEGVTSLTRLKMSLKKMQIGGKEQGHGVVAFGPQSVYPCPVGSRGTAARVLTVLQQQGKR